MKILFILLSTLILFSLIPLSFSDATFEIRSDIEVAIRLSLRPSPISIIMKNYRNADQFFKNFKNIITNLRPQMLTPPARDNIDTLEAITKINYQQSAKFFNNDYMTIWYNKMRRFLEANYVFTNMYEINDKFLQTMTSKKAPRCWNRFRENVKNVTQYYVVTAVYKKVEDFLFNKFSGYKNESLTFLEGSKKIGPGNSASFFLTTNINAMTDLHNRWMSDLDQLKHENNQTEILKPIIDDAFNKTLPDYESILANVTDCALPKKLPPAA